MVRDRAGKHRRRLIGPRNLEPTDLAGMLAPPFLGPRYTRAFNAIFPELAAKYGLPFYPFLLAGVAGNQKLNLPDRVHPNAQGIARMVKGVAPLVMRAVR